MLPCILPALLGHDAKDLQRNGLRQAVVDIVERIGVDVELALPCAAFRPERQIFKVDPGTIDLLQLSPLFVALLLGQFGIVVNDVLELIDHAAIGQELQGTDQVDQLGRFGLIAIEALQIGPCQELHRHGMDFAALQCRLAETQHLVIFQHQRSRKSMAAFVGKDFNITGSTVEVGKDERCLEVGQGRAVAARHLIFAGIEVERTQFVHAVDHGSRLGIQLAVERQAGLIKLFILQNGLGIAFQGHDAVIVEADLIQTQASGLLLLELADQRNDITLDLIAEVLHHGRIVAVAGHAQITQRGEVGMAQCACHTGTDIDHLVINGIVFFLVGQVGTAFGLIGLLTGLTVAVGLELAHLGDGIGLAAELDGQRALYLLVFDLQQALFLHHAQDFGRNGLEGDLGIDEGDLAETFLHLRTVGAFQHGLIEAVEFLHQRGCGFGIILLFGFIELIGGILAGTDGRQRQGRHDAALQLGIIEEDLYSFLGRNSRRHTGSQLHNRRKRGRYIQSCISNLVDTHFPSPLVLF